MKRIDLNANKRTVFGRKVKQLRRNQIIPGNIFGKQVASLAIEVPQAAFLKAYGVAGETGLIDLNIDGEKKPVLIQNVQMHTVSNQPLHIDFYQVDLKQKVKANVPVEFIGKAQAVEQKLGLLLELLDEVEVEAFPTDLPEKMVIDVTPLAKVGDTIKVSQLTLPSGVAVLTNGETEIIKVGSLVSKEAEALAAEEAAKAAAAAETASAPAASATTTEAVAPVAPTSAPAKSTGQTKAEK